MSEITDVKTEGEPTADLICPLMSGQIVPVAGRAGHIDTPGASILAPSIVTCARENCQWWDESADECAIWTIAQALFGLGQSVPDIKSVLEPATESPLVRICDTLDQIWKMMDRSGRLDPKPSEPRPPRGYKRD